MTAAAFRRLRNTSSIGLSKSNPNNRGFSPITAAETMLSARQGSRALKFAEAGLIEARKQNNRDLEGHFVELADAARRQGG